MHHSMARLNARRKYIEHHSPDLRLQNFEEFRILLQILLRAVNRCR
jgi:hypothetical protein